MKFIIVFAAALTVVAAQPSLFGNIVNDVASGVGAVVGGIDGVIGDVGNVIGDVTNATGGIIRGVTNATGGLIGGIGGLLGDLLNTSHNDESGENFLFEILQGDVDQIVQDLVSAVGNLTGLKGLGCFLENTLDNVETLINKIDEAVGGLVCNVVNTTTGLASGVTNTVGSTVASATGQQAIGNAISGLNLSSLNTLGCSLKGVLAPVANLVGLLSNDIGGNNCSANATLLGN